MTFTHPCERSRGTWVAVGTFVLWGLAPLYWQLLKAVPSLQIVLHRVVWSALLVAAFLFWRDGRHWFGKVLAGHPRLWWMLLLSGLLISCNWGLYIWAVNAGHVVETALGYFINPLLNVVITCCSCMSDCGHCNGPRWRWRPPVCCGSRCNTAASPGLH